jgi:hypothetical protein
MGSHSKALGVLVAFAVAGATFGIARRSRRRFRRKRRHPRLPPDVADGHDERRASRHRRRGRRAVPLQREGAELESDRPDRPDRRHRSIRRDRRHRCNGCDRLDRPGGRNRCQGCYRSERPDRANRCDRPDGCWDVWPTGPIGPTGPPGADTFARVTRDTTTDTVTIPPGGGSFMFTTCPSGQAVGGGVNLPNWDGDVEIHASYPDSGLATWAVILPSGQRRSPVRRRRVTWRRGLATRQWDAAVSAGVANPLVVPRAVGALEAHLVAARTRVPPRVGRRAVALD